MSLWFIHPRDPLIFRDGRPFTNAPGSRAKTLPFPYPSTIAGAIRTLAGIDPRTGRFNKDRIQDLLQISVRGPFLVEQDNQNDKSNWMFPAPADAVLFSSKKNNHVKRYSLSPLQMPAGTNSDLVGYELVGFSTKVKEKPISNPPRFWSWTEYKKWLKTPNDGPIDPKDIGIRGPQLENRTHVSIEPNTLASLSGALFQTSGLEFTSLDQDQKNQLSKARELFLAVETDADLKEGLGFMGGERRIARWRAANTSLPDCPSQVSESIQEQRACRLILMTPAFFTNGFLPQWIKDVFGVDIIAAVTGRYQIISGWDYGYQSGSRTGQPKPTRRLVPAGSVYFLRLAGDKAAIQDFIDNVWMMPVSDDEQSRRDGFGVSVLGTWSGQLRNVEWKS